MSVNDWKIIGPLAYMGKEDCRDGRCRRRWGPDGAVDEGCLGWHCSYCDEPCGPQGHKCEVGTTLLDESRRLADEDAA